ncbi:MAG: hypothetical protein LBI31_00075 [Zoogloeaceae bacterium]|nr:hypothetical protein [Zoogloeaceae bacterium]
MAVSASAASYTKLILALIDRCLASNNGVNFQYKSILDVADLIPPKQYKIDMEPYRY